MFNPQLFPKTFHKTWKCFPKYRRFPMGRQFCANSFFNFSIHISHFKLFISSNSFIIINKTGNGKEKKIEFLLFKYLLQFV